MTSDELKTLRDNVLYNGQQIREKQLDTKYLEIKDLLLSYHGNDFEEKKYNFLRDNHTRPVCKNCGGYVKFAYQHGYHSYCSKPCEIENIKKIKAARTPEEIEAENEKRRQTVKKKYGVEYVTQTVEHKDKIKGTNNERYGGNAPTSSKEVIKTRQRNNMEKWGVKEFPETKEFKDKVKETCQKNWGYDSHLLHPDFQKISQDAMEEKYGVRFPYQNKEIRDKATEKCIIAIDNPEVREKQKITAFNNLKEKMILTHQEKIGNKYHILDYTTKHEFIIEHEDGHIFNIQRGLMVDRLRFNCSEISTVLNPLGSSTSSHEIELRQFLDSLNIEYIKNTKKVLQDKRELDIFIPSANLALEINGLYWHSTKNIDDNDYHISKTKECNKIGINLFHIFEDDWMFKKDIVKSIIKNKLGLIDNKIYARKCEIREVSHQDSMVFLDNNHIQGGTITSLRLGLYHNDILVSLMVFRYTPSKKKEYELSRFCSLLNTTVIGGASKLFTYFLKNNEDIDNIVSFSDIGTFGGTMYETLGFHYVHTVPPDYHWVINGRRKHKSLFMKKKLIADGSDPSKTEKEIMEEKGYYRIYSAGLIKWVYKR